MPLDFSKIKVTQQAEVSEAQTENAPELSAQSSEQSNDAPSHFDDLIAASDIQSEGGAVSLPTSAILRPEEFHKVFCLAFNVSSTVTRLKSLRVDENDDGALGASKAIYDTCLEIPALHFLVQPGGKWGGRILAIGAFAVPLSLAVKEELQERRAAVLSSAGGASIPSPEDTLAKFSQ